MNKYIFDDYDAYSCPKVPILLVITILFASRHVLLVPIAYLPIFGSNVGYLSGHLSQLPMLLISGIPGTLVFVAFLRRHPDTGKFWRTIWQHGRHLLTISFLAQISSLLLNRSAHLSNLHNLQDEQRITLVSLTTTLLAMYYLWRFAKNRDVFACFPGPTHKR